MSRVNPLGSLKKTGLPRSTSRRQEPSWDAIRCFLNVARAQSLSGAARHLGESQPTVSRRIRELEQTLAVKLFVREPTGVSLTAEGHVLLERARAMDEISQVIDADALALVSRGSRRIVVSAPPSYGIDVIVPGLAENAEALPGLSIDLVLSNEKMNLANRACDIVIRFGDPIDPALVGRRLGKVQFGLYASMEYIAKNGEPEGLGDLSRHAIIGGLGELAGLPQTELLRDARHGVPPTLRVSSVAAQSAAVQSSLGIAPLPDYIAVQQGELVQVLPQAFQCALDLWLLTHVDLRQVNWIKSAVDVLNSVIHADRARFSP